MMRLILLPAFDGTGSMFNALVKELGNAFDDCDLLSGIRSARLLHVNRQDKKANS